MTSIAARLVACLVAVLALVAAWFYVQALRGALATAQDAAHTAQETVGRRDALIVDLQKKDREHATQLAQLEGKPVRAHYSFTQGFGMQGALGVAGALRPALYRRLSFTDQ